MSNNVTGLSSVTFLVMIRIGQFGVLFLIFVLYSDIQQDILNLMSINQ